MKAGFRVYTSLQLSNICKEIGEIWAKNNTFEKSIKNRKGKEEYVFYEGPPSANGAPGIHHIFSRTIKDSFCRYKTLQGFHVTRKSGWDTHGLPVELQVEKALGITKDDIGIKISIEDYNKRCRESVMEFKERWQLLTKELGYWVDMENPYVTCDNSFMESEWWAFKQLYDKGLVYQGFKIQPYSPAAGTGLSSHELNQPGCYRDVKDLTATVKFQSIDDKDVSFLAWTTTPWTLPANSALAIGENINYVKVKTFNPYSGLSERVILAEAALNRYFNTAKTYTEEDFKNFSKPQNKEDIPFIIERTFKGKDLLKKQYKPLFEGLPQQGGSNAFIIIPGDFVTTEEGTGIVHIAPTFGADDMRVAKEADISSIMVERKGQLIPIVDSEGKYVEEVKLWAGRYVKEEYEKEETKLQQGYKPLDIEIITNLKERNLLFRSEKHIHSYPHCWRTDKPILYYPLKSWFIKTTQFKEKMLELNKTINWRPQSTGTGRFGNWIENLVDWNVSRDRFWGTPIPIWQTEDKDETICIGSIEELKNEIKKSISAGFMDKELPEDFDLHKPYIDRVILVSKNGKKMYRVNAVLDVWFNSGSMPYAQLHYPFENKDLFEKKFPANFIAEGVDQTRGWFFTLHALSTMLFDNVAYKNVISNGLVLDKFGNKMSKRLGNSVDPFNMLDEYGADALRWYILSNGNPGDNLLFDVDGVQEVSKKLFSTLYNTYNFFAMYANLDDFDGNSTCVNEKNKQEIDRWIISKMNSLIKNVEKYLDDYDPTKATRAIQEFVIDDLSNWYVRLNRKRFWKSDNSEDKLIAYQTLYECLDKVAILMSPFAPFYSELLYRDLHKDEIDKSVHLSDFPKYDNNLIDEKLEDKMSTIRGIVSTVHAMRKIQKMKIRQPLNKVMIHSQNHENDILELQKLILAETNIKQLQILTNAEVDKYVEYTIKPNFAMLKQKCKSDEMQKIIKEVIALKKEEISCLLNDKMVNLSCGIELTKNDILFQTKVKEDICIDTYQEETIILDTHISKELFQECIARDFINAVQKLRKEHKFDVQDRIEICIKTKDAIVIEALEINKSMIGKEILAENIYVKTEINGDYDVIEINEVEVSLQLQIFSYK